MVWFAGEPGSCTMTQKQWNFCLFYAWLGVLVRRYHWFPNFTLLNTSYSASATADSVILTETLLHMNEVKPANLNLVLYIPLLVTNVVATSFIGYKLWYVFDSNYSLMWDTHSKWRIYRREIRIHIISGKNGGNGVNNVLILLTESGLLYCFFWVRRIPKRSLFSILKRMFIGYHHAKQCRNYRCT